MRYANITKQRHRNKENFEIYSTNTHNNFESFVSAWPIDLCKPMINDISFPMS